MPMNYFYSFFIWNIQILGVDGDSGTSYYLMWHLNILSSMVPSLFNTPSIFSQTVYLKLYGMA